MTRIAVIRKLPFPEIDLHQNRNVQVVKCMEDQREKERQEKAGKPVNGHNS